MTITFSDMKLEDLALEPQDGAEAAPAAKERAKFPIETRSGGDRRSGEDRRQSIRFEADRRKGDRRAGRAAWGKGSY